MYFRERHQERISVDGSRDAFASNLFRISRCCGVFFNINGQYIALTTEVYMYARENQQMRTYVL